MLLCLRRYGKKGQVLCSFLTVFIIIVKEVTMNFLQQIAVDVPRERLTNMLDENLATAKPEELEIEVRFGHFESEQDGVARFHGGISVNAYNRLIDRHATSHGHFEVHSEHVLVPMEDKVTVHVDEQRVQAQAKEKLSILEVPRWGFKLQTSKESMLSESDYNRLLPTINASRCIRRKRQRKSFWLIPNTWRLDVTEVNTMLPDAPCSETSWEAELEYVSHRNEYISIQSEQVADQMFPIVHSLLQIIQDSFHPIPFETFRMLENEVLERRQAHPYLGAVQPRGLKKADMSPKTFGEDTQYAVTLKADGERAMMMVGSGGTAYIYTAVDGWREMPRYCDMRDRSSPSWMDFEGCLLDGEYDGHRFYAFDVLSSGKVTIQAMALPERLKVMQFIRDMMQNHFEVKDYEFFRGTIQLRSAARRLLTDAEENGPFTIDGLIITPTRSLPTYRTKTWPEQMKWKMQPTIDAMFSTDPKDTSLYVMTDVSKGNVDGLLKFHCAEANLYPGRVAEFRWVKNQLLFLRLRPDKKTPNHILVAEDIMNSCRDPITRAIITGKALLLPSVPNVPTIPKKPSAIKKKSALEANALTKNTLIAHFNKNKNASSNTTDASGRH